MASYMHTKDIKPEDLEIDKLPELSKKEKIKNWFYYTRKILIAGAVGLLLLIWMLVDIFGKATPDISIGIVSPYGMPDGFVEKLIAGLEDSIEDLNGDGKIKVHVETFQINVPYITPDGTADVGEENPQVLMAATTRLAAVHQGGTPHIFILEENAAEYYQEHYALIGDDDGNFFDEGNRINDDMRRWSESEFLSGLDLSFEFTEIEINTMQDILANYYVGMMPLWDSQKEKPKVYDNWLNAKISLLEWYE